MKIEIIAEIANTHCGNLEKAINLGNEAAKSSPDAIKFQMFKPEELLSKDHKDFKHFQNLSFSEGDWRIIFSEVRKYDIPIYADIYGVDSLKIANNLNIDGYKIHTSDIFNIKLLKSEFDQNKPLFVSCGGVLNIEIIKMLKYLKSDFSRIILMHGFQSYPTKLNDISLKKISELKRIFGHTCEIGFQDHIDADDDFAYYLPLMAISEGAKVIEKHFTLDRTKKEIDYYSSLQPTEFKNLVSIIRRSQEPLNLDKNYISSSELKYSKNVRKHWVATRKIKKGQVLKIDDVEMVRINNAKSFPISIENILNKKTIKNIEKHEIVNRSSFKQKVSILVITRSASERLKNKATITIKNHPLITFLINRLKTFKNYHQIVLCTTKNKEDDILEPIAKSCGIRCYRGSTNNLVDRMIKATDSDTDFIIRATGDDLLISIDHAEKAVDLAVNNNLDYVDMLDLPDGSGVEVFSYESLINIYEAAEDLSQSEYLSRYILDNKHLFKIDHLEIEKVYKKNWRLTLDYKEDLRAIKPFLEYCLDKEKHFKFNIIDLINFYENNIKIFDENKNVKQKQLPKNLNTKLDLRKLI
mgnify:CR=1 FL=1